MANVQSPAVFFPFPSAEAAPMLSVWAPSLPLRSTARVTLRQMLSSQDSMAGTRHLPDMYHMIMLTNIMNIMHISATTTALFLRDDLPVKLTSSNTSVNTFFINKTPQLLLVSLVLLESTTFMLPFSVD